VTYVPWAATAPISGPMRASTASGMAARISSFTPHPTVKPVAMVADAIRDCSRRKGIILDPFAGSGTTLIAAERTGRRGFGIELDPLYCDVILRRLRSVCGLQAVLQATSQKFEEVAAQRQENSRLPEPNPASPLLRGERVPEIG